MYSATLIRSIQKDRLSNFVDGVSHENIMLLLAFIFTGITVFIITPYLVKNHEREVARNEWNKKQKLLSYPPFPPVGASSSETFATVPERLQKKSAPLIMFSNEVQQ